LRGVARPIAGHGAQLMKHGKRDKGRLLSPQKMIRMKWSSVCIVFDGRSCGSIGGASETVSIMSLNIVIRNARGIPHGRVQAAGNARRFLTRVAGSGDSPIRAWATACSSGLSVDHLDPGQRPDITRVPESGLGDFDGDARANEMTSEALANRTPSRTVRAAIASGPRNRGV